MTSVDRLHSWARPGRSHSSRRLWSWRRLAAQTSAPAVRDSGTRTSVPASTASQAGRSRAPRRSAYERVSTSGAPTTTWRACGR